MDSKKTCPFCSLDPERLISESDSFNVIRDGFPISPGHTLIIPKRHTNSLFGLTQPEFFELYELIHQIKTELDDEFSPDSYNIGINDGPAAGQTVPHLHIHVIPRYQGDQVDPRGGVRWIIPEKAKYWDD